MTQDRLATELGVNRVTVARWELGEREPRGNLRLAYAELLRQLQIGLGMIDDETASRGADT